MRALRRRAGALRAVQAVWQARALVVRLAQQAKAHPRDLSYLFIDFHYRLVDSKNESQCRGGLYWPHRSIDKLWAVPRRQIYANANAAIGATSSCSTATAAPSKRILSQPTLHRPSQCPLCCGYCLLLWVRLRVLLRRGGGCCVVSVEVQL